MRGNNFYRAKQKLEEIDLEIDEIEELFQRRSINYKEYSKQMEKIEGARIEILIALEELEDIYKEEV